MGKLEIKMTRSGAELHVQMSGIIDEDVDFTQQVIAKDSQIEFDLAGIKSINSCGIREWIKWLTTAQSGVISFINCPKVIIDQMNMVDGFLPSNGKVKSFFVPYYNEESGTEKNILYSLGKEYDQGQLNPPAEIKDDQGHVMEMDVIEAKYFKFLKR